MSNRFVAIGSLFLLTNIAAAQEPAPLPAKVDLVPQFKKFALAPGAQGDRDVCSLFAITSLADFESSRSAKADYQRLSPEFLIWAARQATGHKGEQSMFFEAVHGLNTLGICTEERLAYTEKPNVDGKRKPPKAALADANERAHRWKVNWIKRWDVNRPLTAAEMHAIKETLAAGHPVACGLRWPNKLEGYTILDVPPANQVSDGHSIAFVGYENDPTKPGGGIFRFRNSWGPQWGLDGYGLMSFAYARAYANDAVWLELERPGAEVPAQRFEAEALAVLAKSNCEPSTQEMNQWGGPMWSQGKQCFCAAKNGGFLELGLEVRTTGRYRVRVLGTAGPDFGKVRIALVGKGQGPTFDLYCGRVSPSGTLELGTHELAAGRHAIRFHVEGKNAASTGFFFGIDTVDLLPPK
jgi:hypothetical protein